MGASPDLRDATDTLFRAVAAVADALYVVDADGRIAFLNPAALDNSGLYGRGGVARKAEPRNDPLPPPRWLAVPDAECPLFGRCSAGRRVCDRARTGSFEARRFDASRSRIRLPRSNSMVAGAQSSPSATCPSGCVWERWRRRGLASPRATYAAAGRSCAISTTARNSSSSRSRLSSRTPQPDRGPAGGGGTPRRHRSNRPRAAIEELRRLANGIHPPELSDHGLDAALRMLAPHTGTPSKSGSTRSAGWRRRSSPRRTSSPRRRQQTPSSMRAPTTSRSPCERTTKTLRVNVTDNGIGGATFNDGTGLQGLRDRAEAIGGQLNLDSPVGGPTLVTAELPTPARTARGELCRCAASRRPGRRRGDDSAGARRAAHSRRRRSGRRVG